MLVAQQKLGVCAGAARRSLEPHVEILVRGAGVSEEQQSLPTIVVVEPAFEVAEIDSGRRRVDLSSRQPGNLGWSIWCRN